jgi:hypothetical protein
MEQMVTAARGQTVTGSTVRLARPAGPRARHSKRGSNQFSGDSSSGDFS